MLMGPCTAGAQRREAQPAGEAEKQRSVPFSAHGGIVKTKCSSFEWQLTGKWRGYFYHPETGDRAQRLRAQRPRRLVDYESFKPSKFAYMMQKTQPKEDPVGGQLAQDANWVCAQVQAAKPHPDRPALSNTTPDMPTAARVGGR